MQLISWKLNYENNYNSKQFYVPPDDPVYTNYQWCANHQLKSAALGYAVLRLNMMYVKGWTFF